MSEFSQEKDIQKKLWTLKPGLKNLTVFDALVQNEFLPDEIQLARRQASLTRTLEFAFEYVPYYKELGEKLGLASSGFRKGFDLSLLPVLTRRDIQDHFKTLRAAALPRNDKIVGTTKTSGTTGEPVQVIQTLQNARMFNLLKQRELRWFRWDPTKRLASIRVKKELPFRDKNIKKLHGEEYCRVATWPLVGGYFETGPFYGFDLTRPIETQIKWLSEIKPTYLMMLAARMEHLAMGFPNQHPLKTLQGLQAISQQLTGAMRNRIEEKIGVPVQQNYGLNEIGIVAVRCPEGDRYHVHSEHCMVEVVDATGKACTPGDNGRLLVTGFSNFGMPLIRYDTGDWAAIETTPCPCGRTLPSFGKIQGRYNNILSLPTGSYDYYAACYGTLENMPPEVNNNLRQYQIHLCRDGSFELRLVIKDTLPPVFEQKLLSAWNSLGTDPPTLKIQIVDTIPVPANGKFQVFTSDFF